jgi:hypothetical protein
MGILKIMMAAEPVTMPFERLISYWLLSFELRIITALIGRSWTAGMETPS